MDVNTIKYRPGEFYKFIATRKFRLGQLDLQIEKGDEVLFDGSTLILHEEQYSDRSFRGAVKSGWAILAEYFDDDEDVREMPEQRISANIQISRPSIGGNPMAPRSHSAISVEADEREVGFVRTASQRAEISTRSAPQTSPRPTGQARQGSANTFVRGQEVDNATVEAQDGVPVREVKTIGGAEAKNLRVTVGQDGHVVQALKNLKVEPGRGISQEEFLANMSEEEREEYLAQKEAVRDSILAEVDAKAQARMNSATTLQKRVGKAARNQNGFRVTPVNRADGAVAINTPIASTQATSKVEVEGITFHNTGMSSKENVPQAKAPVNDAVLRKVAKSVCPDFPDNYRFDLPPRKKLARVMADFEDRPDVILAIFAAEDEEMRAALQREFPHVFNS